MNPSLFAAQSAAAEAMGWTPGNAGENRLAIELHRLGMRPSGRGRAVEVVVQQYRVGQYRVDFAWPELRIALEADGWVHRTDDSYARDRVRDAWLRDQGWLVFRLDADDPHEGDLLVRIVRFVKFEAGTL